MEQYTSDGYLQSTIKFVTIDVENLYTMIPGQGALNALARFYIQHSIRGKIRTFTIEHIMKMARLIAARDCFAFNHQYCKQLRRGAMGSAFTQVSTNIYMFE